MATTVRRKRYKRTIIIAVSVLFLFFALIIFLANVYVEPVLRKKLQTIIVDGSDSLYTYQLKALDVNLFGGSVKVSGLQIALDSARFEKLRTENAVPPMVLQINLEEARIKGIGIFALLFSKKILVNEIVSTKADVRLSRYPKEKDTVAKAESDPLWKSIQKTIKDVKVNRIKLEGIRLLYKNAEGSEAAKLQFDRCDALFEDIHIDSTALTDTSRIGYVQNFSLRFNDVKFRTPDSLYKMKAEWITYNSQQRVLEVDSFKLQPTLGKEDRLDSFRRSWYNVTFDRVRFMGLRLDRFLRYNRVEADSILFQSPKLAVYQDKLGLKSYASKIGKYPHQQLINAGARINIKKLIARNMQVEVTEKHAVTRQEGTLNLDGLEIEVDNIVNDPVLVRQNPVATAKASGKIIGSPIEASFRFYLDSANGRFDAQGRLQNVQAKQINSLSTTLANIEVPSANIEYVNFSVRGEDYGTTANVQMQYSNLSIVFLKRDEATGANVELGFLNKMLNRYAIYTSNPASGSIRTAENVRVARLTTQSFFGVIWQSVFAGMQKIMLRGE